MKLTQEQLAELIAKIYANIGEKRKARKESGDETADIGTDDILAELTVLLDGIDGENDSDSSTDSGNAADDEKSEEGTGTADYELIAKIIAALKDIKSNGEPAEAKRTDSAGKTKSAESSKETKSSNRGSGTGVKRKYAGIFMSSGADRDGNTKQSSFKSRIAAMSAPERRKEAYGMFGRAIKCVNTCNGDSEKAAYTAEHAFKDAEMAREFKALSATTPSDGGYLIPEVYANEIIELLYPSTVIYSLGARRLSMSNGNLNIPKMKTGSRAMFVGENRPIPKTGARFGNLKLSAKKLTALIPMSNDLLRSTNFDNDVIVGQDVTKQMSLGVDYGALLGNGGEFQPLGITNNKKVLNIDVTSLDADYASSAGILTAAFPNYLIAAVLKNNVYASGLGFVFNTSVEQFFKSLRDNVGGFVFADEMNKNNTLAGYPYKTTNLIETTGGKTQILFGNWNDLIIGEQGALEIDTRREGSWTDDTGNLISAFENDQTLIRAIDNVDMGLRHEESFAVATKVSVPV